MPGRLAAGSHLLAVVRLQLLPLGAGEWAVHHEGLGLQVVDESQAAV
jgi:hypothetical protein